MKSLERPSVRSKGRHHGMEEPPSQDSLTTSRGRKSAANPESRSNEEADPPFDAAYVTAMLSAVVLGLLMWVAFAAWLIF